MSRSLPLVGIPTLDILAAQVAVDTSRPLACVLAAGRGRLALGWYEAQNNGWQAKGSASVTTAEAVAAEVTSPALLTGELTAAERQLLIKNENILLASPAASARRPGILAELAFRRWQAGQTDPAASLAPIYLHIGEVILDSLGSFPLYCFQHPFKKLRQAGATVSFFMPILQRIV